MIEKLKKMQALWKELSLAGIWIATIAGSFLLPLPDWASNDEKESYSKYIVFIATALAGFVLALTFKLKSKRFWCYLVFGAFVTFNASFFLYMQLHRSSTSAYGDVNGTRRIVIGTDTVVGFASNKKLMEKHLGFGVKDTELLNYVGGNAAIIWTDESIESNKFKLIFSLLLAYAALAIFLISFLNFLLTLKAIKEKKIAVAAVLLLFSVTVDAQNDSIVARTELQRLNKMFGYRAELKFEPTFSAALSSELINISLPELKKISAVSDRPTRLYLVRFIVAHEFAHHIQFYKYRNNSRYLSNDDVSRMMIEAQADVLGGLMFGKLSPELNVYMQTEPERFDEIFKRLYVSIYDMGTTENTHGTHPSKADRVMAMKLGMFSGVTHNLDELYKERASNGIVQPLSLIDHRNLFKKILDFIDLNENEDSVEWAYRQAKKIIGYDRSIANNVVLITPLAKAHQFKNEAGDANYYYDLIYKNIGNKSIDVEMEVYVEAIQKINGKDYGDKYNTQQHKFTIPAGATRRISGKLNWKRRSWDKEINGSVDNEGYMRLIYPGVYTSDALISCKYTNETSVVPGTKIEYLGVTGSQTASLKFPNFYQALFNKVSLPGRTTTGVGRLHDRYDNTVVYASSIQFEEGSETYILVDTADKTSRPLVEVIFPFSSMAKYKELKTMIAAKWTNGKTDEYTLGSLTKYTLEVDEVYLVLELMKSTTASDKYAVRLSFLWD
jgi:hypothetical protein